MAEKKNSYSSEMVQAPKYWKSGPGHPPTELAYITQAEKDALVDLDIHGTLKDGPHEGPAGITSLNGDYSMDWGGGSTSGGNGSHDRGGGQHQAAYQAAVTQPTRATVATTAPQEDIGARDSIHDYIDNKVSSTLTPAQKDVIAGVITGDAGVAEQFYAPDDYTVQDDLTDYAENVMKKAITTGEGGFQEPTFEGGTGGEGVYTPPVTQADVTPPVEEETGLTEAEHRALIDAHEYGTNFPTDIGALPYDVAGQRDLSGLIDPRMQRAYAENVQLMTAADGGRAGYYDGELVEDDDEETIRAQALASLPQYQLFSQRRKAALGGRMGYNQGGIVGLRQPAAFGGIMGPDGRRGYFLGSIGKVFKSITKPIKKIVKSPIGKAALIAGLGYFAPTYLGSLDKGATLAQRGGWWKKAIGKGLSKINPSNWGGEQLSAKEIFQKSVVENAKLPVTQQLSRDEIMKFALAESKKQVGKLSGMDMAAAVAIPTIMGATAKYTAGTEQDDTADMNAYLAEQDKLADPWRKKFGKTVPTDFQTLPYSFAAQGGRIGYQTGERVGDTPEVLGPVTPGKGLGDIDQGDFNLSDLGEYTQMYPSTDKSAERAKIMAIVKRLIELGMAPEKAVRMAVQVAKRGMEGLAQEDTGRPLWPKGREMPKWSEMPRNIDKGFYVGKPELHRDATQIPHHLDINPLRTMEFRDRNQDGIEDRSQGIYDQPRDFIPWEFDKGRKWKRDIPPEILEQYKKHLSEGAPEFATGGRIGAQEGGLMNLGGMEKDYREEGGFVPIGGEEKADDVPARLSKNEFVFTADAVRNAGGGDIDAGAEVMENLMNHLEAGGKVSEESQGLEGARGMFANAQELEKRII